MWGGKLLAAILLTSGMTMGAWRWKITSTPKTDTPAAGKINKIEQYVYPGAQRVSSSDSVYIMVAEAGIDEVTNWYNHALDLDRMNSKSIIKSNTNGDKINLLIGSGLAGEVDIAIKEETANMVTIAVTNNASGAQQI